MPPPGVKTRLYIRRAARNANLIAQLCEDFLLGGNLFARQEWDRAARPVMALPHIERTLVRHLPVGRLVVRCQQIAAEVVGKVSPDAVDVVAVVLGLVELD